MAIENDKELKNLEVLRDFRLGGKPVRKGSVIAKSDFQNSGDWLNLCAMTPPRVKQTKEKVAAAPKSKTAALPGSKD